MDPTGYTAENSLHRPFYLNELNNLPAYTSSLPHYLQAEIDRIIEKPEIVLLDQSATSNNKDRGGAKTTLRLTGYSVDKKSSRILDATDNVLSSMLHSLLYFFTAFGWISNDQSAQAFENRSCR